MTSSLQWPAPTARSARSARTALAAATAVLTAAGALTGCGSSGSTVVTEPEIDERTTLDCPKSSEPPGRPRSGGASKLVDGGAVVARLCLVDTAANKDLPPPEDGLTEPTLHSGVGSLVRKVNSLPDANANAICTMDIGPTYLLVLGYPDGRKARVTFEAFGCGTVRAGDNFSAGGRELRQTYAELLKAQGPRPSPTTPR